MVEESGELIIPAGAHTRFRTQAIPPSIGEKRTRIVIHSDSATMPELSIPVVLRGRPLAVPSAHFAPTEVRLEGTTLTESVEKTIEIQTLEQRDSIPWLRGFRTQQPEIECSLDDLSERESRHGTDLVVRGYRYRIRAPVPGTDQVARIEWLLPVLSEESPETILPIRVVATRVPEIRVIPSELFVSVDAKDGRAVERSLVLLGAKEIDPRLLTIDAPDVNWISVRHGDGSSARVFVRISAPEDTQEVLLRTAIGLRVGDASHPAIKVPVTVAIARK